ncbi:MAG: stage III sporulation protein AA [Provencibacterium sp.]|nr:stage III sporulation protein AA [Provencibacterium sp.]
MEQQNIQRFYEAAGALSDRVQAALRRVDSATAAGVQEIRMRAGRPLALYMGDRHLFVEQSGACRSSPGPQSFLVTRADLFESFRTLCGYSVHTHQAELAHGYISVAGGHRAGVCGTVSGEGERAGAVRDILSINLRIARQVKGIALPVARKLFADGLCGVLVAGAPASGKTTLLRDLARVLSSGELGEYYKVSVVDERCELAAVSGGMPCNDLGLCTDLLCGYPKSVGIEMAVRTLSPQVIICDEVGRQDELEAIRMGLYSAVQVIATVHCAGEEELLRRPQARALLETGAFQKVALLEGSAHPGQVRRVLDAAQLCG